MTCVHNLHDAVWRHVTVQNCLVSFTHLSFMGSIPVIVRITWSPAAAHCGASSPTAMATHTYTHTQTHTHAHTHTHIHTHTQSKLISTLTPNTSIMWHILHSNSLVNFIFNQADYINSSFSCLWQEKLKYIYRTNNPSLLPLRAKYFWMNYYFCKGCFNVCNVIDNTTGISSHTLTPATFSTIISYSANYSMR